MIIVIIFAILLGGFGIWMMFGSLSMWFEFRDFYKFSDILEDWSEVWFTIGFMMVLFVIYILLNTL